MSTALPTEIHMQVDVLYNGRTHGFVYHADEHVLTLLEQARREFGVVTNPHLLGLFNLTGQELADGQSLADAGVKAGDELILRPSVIRGG
jgi:hypothetical protein